MTTDRAGPKGPSTERAIVLAMEGHFRRTIEEYSGLPFAKTKVTLPTASFERYAAAILEAIEPAKPAGDPNG